MSKDKPDVDAAYAIKTPKDNLKLYADWADTYDEDFAERLDYRMPAHVAEIFLAEDGAGPVLDAGAGTGLVGVAINESGTLSVDALDLSPEMLRVATAKGVYRNAIVANLLEVLPIKDGTYNSVLSSGTFTHGHVGPKALDELLRVAASNALFVLTIKREHYEEKGFAEKFASFGELIKGFRTEVRDVYGAATTGEHQSDQGLIAVFRKA